MSVSLRIDHTNALSDGRLEVQFSVLVNGAVVASESLAFADPQDLTIEQMKEQLKDRVRGLVERYKKKPQVDALVGQTLEIEP